jgi:hypothetical protein
VGGGKLFGGGCAGWSLGFEKKEVTGAIGIEVYGSGNRMGSSGGSPVANYLVLGSSNLWSLEWEVSSGSLKWAGCQSLMCQTLLGVKFIVLCMDHSSHFLLPGLSPER